uniref:Phosphatidylethanolamine-binding protein n=1 Tax=Acrobeloides nanus TaxID=290746 RepID=A0A914DSM5_9BILA
MSKFFTFFFLLFITWIRVAALIEESFQKYKIVPGVIPKGPKEDLEVLYGDDEVNFGNFLRPSQTRDKPELYWRADANSLYMLVMIDLDAPSRKDPERKENLHWLVVNIPGSASYNGETIIDYIGARPSAGTGPHRYLFLVYEQSNHLNNIKNELKSKRNFKVKTFADKHKLGIPIAGNFFRSRRLCPLRRQCFETQYVNPKNEFDYL